MTKNELIFTVKAEIEGQAATQDGLKFSHPQEIGAVIATAYEKAILDILGNPQLPGVYDLDYFTKTYTESVKKDSNNRLYIDLPAQPIALPGGKGVKSLIPAGGSNKIVRITENEWLDIQHLESFCCSPWPYCYIDFYNKKIILQGNRTEYNLLSEIVLKIIPKFDAFSATDEINSPAGDYSISQMVLQAMGLRPTDNTNDDLR